MGTAVSETTLNIPKNLVVTMATVAHSSSPHVPGPPAGEQTYLKVIGCSWTSPSERRDQHRVWLDEEVKMDGSEKRGHESQPTSPSRTGSSWSLDWPQTWHPGSGGPDQPVLRGSEGISTYSTCVLT